MTNSTGSTSTTWSNNTMPYTIGNGWMVNSLSDNVLTIQNGDLYMKFIKVSHVINESISG